MINSAVAANQLGALLTETTNSLAQLKSCLCTRGCSTYAKTRISRQRERSLGGISKKDKETHEVIETQKITTLYPALYELGLNNLPDDWTKSLNVPNARWLADAKKSKPKENHWNVSHVSASTFLENKLGQNRHRWLPLSMINNERKYLFNVLQRRFASRMATKNRVIFLEEVANRERDNAEAQAEYMKAIVNEDPDYVIRRYESGQYAVDDDVNAQYMKALLITDRLSVREAQRKFAPSSHASHSSKNPISSGSASGTEEQPVHVIMNAPKGSFFREQFWNTVRFLIGLFLILSVVEAQLQMKMSTNQKEIQPDQSEKNIRFEDVQGVDEAKEELQEVVEFLRSPQKFERLGGKLPTGFLLVGKPGTGKTLLARAIAGEAGVPFFFASGSEFDEMFVGVGAARVRNLFAAAREHAPCIVFIDELDAIGGSRVANDHQPYSRMTLNQLLVELDGFDQTEGIVVIGATNFPEILDKALTRPGRFDSKVVVPMPDVRGRKAILDLYLKKVPADEDVDAEVLARSTISFSGAELQNLVNQASIKAAVDNSSLVNMSHFEWARDKITMGPERKSAAIEKENQRLVAYHESGHAIVALFTKGASPLHKATIVPRGQALGMVVQLPEKDELQWSKKQLLARLDVCMGGRVAEEMIFGEDSITTGASSDMQNATQLARAMVEQYGMSEKVGTVLINELHDRLSPELQSLIESEVKQLIKDAYTRAKGILTSKAKEHVRLAEALLKYETLTAEEVELVINGKPLMSK